MNLERILMVLKQPHISEKSATMTSKHAQFAFKVLTDATKLEVKLAVEHLFNVKVKDVNLLNVSGKSKRFKQHEAKRSDWKKAYVSLQSGYDINFSEI